jgi:hypothetical protein
MIFPRMVVLQDAILYYGPNADWHGASARLWAETAVRGKPAKGLQQNRSRQID